jgi:hypothetical protein
MNMYRGLHTYVRLGSLPSVDDLLPEIVVEAERLVARSFREMTDRLDATTDGLLAYLEPPEDP